MSLTIDPTFTDIHEWAADPSMVDDWLYVIYGIAPGTSSRPGRPWGRVHPSSTATSEWLNTLFGFGI